MDIVTLPKNILPRHLNILGSLRFDKRQMNNSIHLFKNKHMKRKFKGSIDEFGFAYIHVNIINPRDNSILDNLKAIIDTGSSYSFIKEVYINDDIKSSNELSGSLRPSGETISSKRYNLNMQMDINNDDGMAQLNGIEFRALTEEYVSDIIIGMDILKYCDFTYRNSSKSLEIEINI